jgi:hypothetical protein
MDSDQRNFWAGEWLMEKWLSANDISKFIGKDKRVVNRWAVRDSWRYRTFDGNGGKQKRFHIADLPEDV